VRRPCTIWTSLPPFGSAPRPFFVALCLPPAALLPAYRGLLFWILVAFLSCPPVRFCLLLVAAARNCIIDRNSENSSGSSPLPPPCAGARDRGSERRGGVRPIDGQDGVRLEVECPPDRESTTGGGSADRRVPALRAAEHTRAPRGGEGPLAQPRIPSKGAARGNDGGALDKVHRQIVMIAPGGIPMGNGHSRVACIRCAGSIAPILRVPPLRRPRSLHPENLRSSPRQRIPRRARTNRYRSASLLAPWTRREAREGTIG
jgi:hypothetical protein